MARAVARSGQMTTLACGGRLSRPVSSGLSQSAGAADETGEAIEARNDNRRRGSGRGGGSRHMAFGGLPFPWSVELGAPSSMRGRMTASGGPLGAGAYADRAGGTWNRAWPGPRDWGQAEVACALGPGGRSAVSDFFAKRVTTVGKSFLEGS